MAGGCTNFVSNSRNADGVTLYQRGQYQQALQQFQEATYADPNNADGYYNLGATYHRLGRLRNPPDSLAQAETCYRQCLERNPNHRDCHRGLAVLLIEENRTPEAFTLIQTWATQQPSLAEPRMELARLYSEFGNKEAATNTLADAVQRNPNDARQWAALGKVREETGNYQQASANYQRSLEINPGQADVAARVAALQGAMAPHRGASAAAGHHPTGRCRSVHARRAVRMLRRGDFNRPLRLTVRWVEHGIPGFTVRLRESVQNRQKRSQAFDSATMGTWSTTISRPMPLSRRNGMNSVLRRPLSRAAHRPYDQEARCLPTVGTDAVPPIHLARPCTILPAVAPFTPNRSCGLGCLAGLAICLAAANQAGATSGWRTSCS